MLNFHIDTFDVFEGWDTDPFKPIEKDGRIYGLGAHDMKAGAACALPAVESIIKSGIKLNGRTLVTATTNEENWGRGTHALINSGVLDDCDYFTVPEHRPTTSLTRHMRNHRHIPMLHDTALHSPAAVLTIGYNSLEPINHQRSLILELLGMILLVFISRSHHCSHRYIRVLEVNRFRASRSASITILK